MTKKGTATKGKPSKVKDTSGLKGAALDAARAANVALVTAGEKASEKAKLTPEIKPSTGAGRANRAIFGVHYPTEPQSSDKNGATFQGLTVVSLSSKGATFTERAEITERKRRHAGNGRKVCLVCGNPLGEKATTDRVTGHCAKVLPLWLTGPLTEYAKAKGWSKAIAGLKAKASKIEAQS